MSFRILHRVGGAFLVVICLASAPSAGATWYVNAANCPGPGQGTQADPFCAIASAINAAISGDEIVVADGTYRGANNKNLDFGGKNLKLRSQYGAANCVIDCENAGRGFYFHSGETAAAFVVGFTIQNGSVGDGSPGGASGGGVYCMGTRPTLINCRIKANTAHGSTAAAGGGVYCAANSAPSLMNCVITGNTASISAVGTARGGGVCSDATASPTPTLTNCTISGNTVSGSTKQGGGVFCTTTFMTLSNSILWANTPTQIMGSPTITYCDVQGGPIGNGNINSDPSFVDANNNNYHLSAGSPCIDAANDIAVPADSADLDGDGDTSEPTPLDLDGFRRFVDTPPTGGSQLDMGAHEYADCDNDGILDGLELAPLPPSTLGLVGYWALDEGSGLTANDSSGYNMHGTVSGAAWVGGVSGTALDVIDHDIVRDIPAAVDDPIVSSNAMTITSWVYWHGPHPGTYSANSYIFDARDVWTGGFILFISSDGRPRFFLIASNGSIHAVDSYAVVPTNTWTHIAAVFDGSSQQVRLCVNGLPVGVRSAPSTYSGSALTAAIGNNRWAPGDNQWAPLNGVVDEVRLYDRALSAGEILGMFTRDCNGNGIPDGCDITAGTSLDDNSNGIPDECEFADCNGNHIPDACDIDCAGCSYPGCGGSTDVDADGVPDECEPDCNTNNLPDDYDLALNTSQDCDRNGVPDECQIRPVLPSPAGLVGFWALDEGSGTTAGDSSGRGMDGTVAGADWVTGVNGTALDVIGTDIIKDVPAAVDDPIVDTDAMTITGWVYWHGQHPETYSANSYIFDARTVGSGGFILYIRYDGRPRFFVIGGNGGIYAVDGSITVSTNTWTHVAAVYDGSNQHMRLCINGVPVGSAGAPATYSGSSLSAAIGNNRWAPGDNQWAPLNGVVDEVRLYNRALSAGEILGMAGRDCNGNGIPDECDIAAPTSPDVNLNGIPDECEPDCNGNNVPDDCDLVCNNSNPDGPCYNSSCTSPNSVDLDGNGVPDECQLPRGDLNCDGIRNFLDIDPFLTALLDPAGYAAEYPDCYLENQADTNGDGRANGLDIDSFIKLLVSP